MSVSSSAQAPLPPLPSERQTRDIGGDSRVFSHERNQVPAGWHLIAFNCP
jgi:hypothetical protein